MAAAKIFTLICLLSIVCLRSECNKEEVECLYREVQQYRLQHGSLHTDRTETLEQLLLTIPEVDIADIKSRCAPHHAQRREVAKNITPTSSASSTAQVTSSITPISSASSSAQMTSNTKSISSASSSAQMTSSTTPTSSASSSVQATSHTKSTSSDSSSVQATSNTKSTSSDSYSVQVTNSTTPTSSASFSVQMTSNITPTSSTGSSVQMTISTTATFFVSSSVQATSNTTPTSSASSSVQMTSNITPTSSASSSVQVTSNTAPNSFSRSTAQVTNNITPTSSVSQLFSTTTGLTTGFRSISTVINKLSTISSIVQLTSMQTSTKTGERFLSTISNSSEVLITVSSSYMLSSSKDFIVSTSTIVFSSSSVNASASSVDTSASSVDASTSSLNASASSVEASASSVDTSTSSVDASATPSTSSSIHPSFTSSSVQPSSTIVDLETSSSEAATSQVYTSEGFQSTTHPLQTTTLSTKLNKVSTVTLHPSKTVKQSMSTFFSLSSATLKHSHTYSSDTLTPSPSTPYISSSSVTKETTKNYTGKATFDGDCQAVLDEEETRIEFKKAFRRLTIHTLEIEDTQFIFPVNPISCGSVIVKYVIVSELPHNSITEKMNKLNKGREMTVNGKTFTAENFVQIPDSSVSPTGPVSTAAPKKEEKKNLLVLYVTIFSVVGVVLIIVIAVIIVGCRRNETTGSFKLGNAADYELGSFQSIPRAKVSVNMYGEGPVLKNAAETDENPTNGDAHGDYVFGNNLPKWDLPPLEIKNGKAGEKGAFVNQALDSDDD